MGIWGVETSLLWAWENKNGKVLVLSFGILQNYFKFKWYGGHQVIEMVRVVWQNFSAEVLKASCRVYFDLVHIIIKSATIKISLPFIITYLGLSPTPGWEAHHKICRISCILWKLLNDYHWWIMLWHASSWRYDLWIYLLCIYFGFFWFGHYVVWGD